MFLMMAEVLNLCGVAENLPQSGFWAFLCAQQSHVEWRGAVLHDLIQPSFTFLVGVVLPFSLADRRAKGASFGALLRHTLWRSLVLVLLGIFLRSQHASQTYFTFEDTLTQIGLGYPFAFLLAYAPPRGQWAALGLVLVGYWAAFALYDLPDAGFKYPAVGVPADWPHHQTTGFAAHWAKNSNLAWAFDTWFLNLFPREKPFLFNGGGYATLSFIPTLGTMLLGLQAGNLLRKPSTDAQKLRWFVGLGLAGLALGLLLDLTGICPNVKRIWTPAWVLFSGGWCALLLALFYGLVEVWQVRKPFFVWKVIGMNSIAAYVLADTLAGYWFNALRIHLGPRYADVFGAAYAPFVAGLLVLTIEWLVLWWLYRRRVFIRV
jgi:predicted acyltransferase